MKPGAQPLSVQGVQVRRGHEVTLSYPDFALSPGAQVAVTGPSGTGKTTLLHVLAGLLRPHAGEVRYGERSLGRLSEGQRDLYRRREVGYVFQDFHLMPGLSALENVELGLRVAGRRGVRDAARAALTRLDLGGRLHHRPAQLSTGERQRVAVARAAAHAPGLLLVDEPTAHLDRGRAEGALTLLRESARTLGATLIVVTHDLDVAGQFSERLHLGDLPSGDRSLGQPGGDA